MENAGYGGRMSIVSLAEQVHIDTEEEDGIVIIGWCLDHVQVLGMSSP